MGEDGWQWLDPYDDPSPVVVPGCPVVLWGPVASRVPVTGAMLSTLSGLPLVDLVRVVEHESGRRWGQLVAELGLAAAGHLEARVLARVLRERLAPVVVLGLDTLRSEACREQVQAAGARLFALTAGGEAVCGGEGVAVAGVHPHRVAMLLLSRLQGG